MHSIYGVCGFYSDRQDHLHITVVNLIMEPKFILE